jgi:hypothetical protein
LGSGLHSTLYNLVWMKESLFELSVPTNLRFNWQKTKSDLP